MKKDRADVLASDAINDIVIDKIKKAIIRYGLFGYNDLVIVALSGGFDSVCLTHGLKKLGYRVAAAHVNHSLRSEADEDEEYVRRLAQKLGIEIYVEKYDVKKFADENRVSIETAGRKLRYDFFAGLAGEYGGVIATAHNQNDSAESFVMHLLRGAGMTGLSGIRPAVDMNGTWIVRPILHVSRQEIEEYCKANDLQPRLDTSNLVCDYYRNEIRHKVMPAIIQRGGLEGIQRAADVISFEDEFLTEYTHKLLCENAKVNDEQTVIGAKWLNSLHHGIKRRVVRMAVSRFSGDYRKPVSLLHVDAIIEMCDKNYGGKLIQLPGKIEAGLNGGNLIIEREAKKC